MKTSQVTSLSESLTNLLMQAPYDPAVGVRLVKLDDASIEGINVSLVHVQVDPGKEIAAHMHEHNGEVCQALSDVTCYLGNTKKMRVEHT